MTFIQTINQLTIEFNSSKHHHSNQLHNKFPFYPNVSMYICSSVCCCVCGLWSWHDDNDDAMKMKMMVRLLITRIYTTHLIVINWYHPLDCYYCWYCALLLPEELKILMKEFNETSARSWCWCYVDAGSGRWSGGVFSYMYT